MSEALLEMTGVSVYVRRGRDRLQVLDKVNLSVSPGEVLGIVGESGSGKSMSMRAATRQLPDQATMTGAVTFAAADIYARPKRALREWRRSEIAFIPQNPGSAMNPTRTVGDFLTEALREIGHSRDAATTVAVDMLRQVDIPDGLRRMNQYPHQLSGGLLQRMFIVAALLVQPRLIIADEPTTALDVTTQEEVIAILRESQRDRGLAMVFITHDLELAAAITGRLTVMYAGRVVEEGATSDVYNSPDHPYTAALLASRPSVQAANRIVSIPGRPKAAYEVASGCAFADRCTYSQPDCLDVAPDLIGDKQRLVACHYAGRLKKSHV
jgi:oligopeptide/dipeptide ABC transporter ATP-binding protein